MGPDELAIPGAEDAERQAAGLPAPGPIVPDALSGPPEPNPAVDNIMAGLPAPAPGAPPAPELPVPDAAPVVPGAPASPVDAALADYTPPPGADLGRTVPGATPPVPGAAPGAPTPPDGPATASAVPVAEDVIKRQGELNEKIAQDKADEAKREAEEAKLNQADMNDAVDKGNGLIADRQKHFDDALGRYQSMKSHEYFDPDNPHKHSKLLAGLSIAFGGLGAADSAAGGGSGENHSLTQLKGRIDDDWKHQNDNIERARDSVVMARTGIEDAKTAKNALLEDNNARRVATLDAMQTEARAQLAERGVPQAKIDTDQRILDLGRARALAAQKADEQRRKDAQTEALTHLYEAKAGRAKRVGSGTGGGGRASAIEAFTAAATDGTTPDSKLAALAVAAGYKPAGVQPAIAAARANMGQGAKVDAKNDVQLHKDLYGPKGPGTALDKIEAMRVGMQKAIASGDGTAATPLLEELGGMLKGGQTSKITVELFEGLKSSGDKFKETWNRVTGDPGASADYQKRLNHILDNIAEEKRAQVDSITKRAETERASHRPGAPSAPSGPVATAKAYLGGGAPVAVPKVPQTVIDAAKAEIKANGPNAASARKMLDQQGITVL